MNKSNLLLLIAMVVLSAGCRKVELPEPKEEAPVFGFWSGMMGNTPMVMNHDSMYMTTKVTEDPALKINTYETTFSSTTDSKPRWIIKYRDSKSMRSSADSNDLFYISQNWYLRDNRIGSTGKVVTHSLKDLSQGHLVTWKVANGDEREAIGGRHFTVEGVDLNGINIITACIDDNGKTNCIKKQFKPLLRDISIEAIEISGNTLKIILEPHSAGNTVYSMNGIPQGNNSTFSIPGSGEYSFFISEASKERSLELKLYLELSNGTIRKPKLPVFTSDHSIQYATLPNFSKMEIIYFDENGTAFSSRYVKQDKPFSIKKIEDFSKTNQQGQKVKKLEIEFSVILKNAVNSDSLNLTGVKGDIGFAYE